MGLVNGALQIGRSALIGYQSALQVLGNNVANAGDAAYVRQTPILRPQPGAPLPEGVMPGGGVALTNLRRNLDSALENRLRIATGEQAAAEIQQKTLGRIEAVMNELSDSDLSTLLQEFFNRFSTLQNSPHDMGVRGMVVAAGEALTGEIQRQRTDVLTMRDELNDELVEITKQANELASQIAELNQRITGIESPSTGAASALRDQRDQLLRDLGELMEIQVREQPDNGINVYVGNELLISSGISRGLTTTLETDAQHPRVEVRFEDNMQQVTLVGGQMAGIITARDTDVMGHVQALNDLSQAVIQEVNKVHSSGQGLQGYEEVTGVFDVKDSDAVLNSEDAGLQLAPQNGSFIVYVTNTQTTPASRIATTIDVDLDGAGNDDTLASLAAKLNAVDDLTAEATPDNRLKLTCAEGCEVSFGQDTSYALAALGVNAFFTGANAEDVQVSADIAGNLDLIAAATDHTVGDGSNAGQMAALATTGLSGLSGQSINDYYNNIASDVAVRASAALAGVNAADSIVASLTTQRESISGVSLDEETISMLRYERAFSAAARYTTVVDSLTQELLAIVR